MWWIAFHDGSAARAFDPDAYLGNHGPWRRHAELSLIADYWILSGLGSLVFSLLAIFFKESIVTIVLLCISLLSVGICFFHIPMFD